MPPFALGSCLIAVPLSRINPLLIIEIYVMPLSPPLFPHISRAGGSVVRLERTTGGGSLLPSTKQRPQESLREAALRVFLLNEQSCPASSRWVESTKPLSLAAVQLCEQCRETIPFDVRVSGDTPRSVWKPRRASSIAESSDVSPATTATTRVPTVKVASLTSDTPHPAELLGSLACAGAFRWLSEVTFGGTSCLSVRGVTWPNQVRALTFKASFAHPVPEVTWPSGLERLVLEGDFNQAVVGTLWPAGLKAVTFGKLFNQPIDSIVWPEGLGELAFGYAFNQAIDHVGQRALGLKRLTLGWQFDQTLDGVVLPEHLEVLSIVGVFNRPLDRVLLPPYLKALTLGGHFNKPLSATLLPRRLEFLSLGWAFNHPLIRVDWPAGLRELLLGYRFNQPANGLAFPPHMQKLELGVFSRQSLKGLAWPSSFKRLTVGRAFDATGGTLPDGAHVCRRGCNLCKAPRAGQELVPRL